METFSITTWPLIPSPTMLSATITRNVFNATPSNTTSSGSPSQSLTTKTVNGSLVPSRSIGTPVNWKSTVFIRSSTSFTLSSTPTSTPTDTPNRSESSTSSNVYPITSSQVIPVTAVSGTKFSHLGAIIGGIVGGVALAFIIALVALLRWHRRKQGSLAREMTFDREIMVRPWPAFSLRSVARSWRSQSTKPRRYGINSEKTSEYRGDSLSSSSSTISISEEYLSEGSLEKQDSSEAPH
ncbi:hypothetical protein F5050DRAFT_1804352 [Lentinula boryana]|uniref:Mid2 domain-containing protein n=1 Tax=Lentinula boryana TaxID=40481 RepID=A0ABQ8QNM6_9AGAR|nr:hypothetical protein F5050DRAFT_1804352 [Lentinula boryana]